MNVWKQRRLDPGAWVTVASSAGPFLCLLAVLTMAAAYGSSTAHRPSRDRLEDLLALNATAGPVDAMAADSSPHAELSAALGTHRSGPPALRRPSISLERTGSSDSTCSTLRCSCVDGATETLKWCGGPLEGGATTQDTCWQVEREVQRVSGLPTGSFSCTGHGGLR